MNSQIVYTPEGLKLQINVRRRNYRYDGTRPKNTRVFVWHNEESVLDNFQNRRDRPTRFYRKYVLPTIREVMNYGDKKMRWSSKAGCFCPCSPGFIVSGTEYRYEDVSVTVDGAPLVKETL